MIITATEVFDILNDFRKRGYTLNIKNVRNKGNIARLAKGSIMEFPTLVSNSLGIQEVLMINKALERQYTTYIRLAMSVDDVITDDMSKRDYIQKFHRNDTSIRESALHDMLSEDYSIFNENAFDTVMDNYRKANNFINTNLNNGTQQTSTSVDYPERYNCDASKSQFSKQLLDNDVKKANEMIPSTIDITVYRPNKGYDHILIGVKTITHPVSSDEMITNISTTLREKRNFFRFVQWTTGEIKFMKDYVLSVDRQKREALASGNESHWWRRLKTKSTISKLKSIINADKNKLIPNATLVLSIDEVEYINNLYDIDLMDIKNVKKLIDTYFLLGFVIVDPATEICYFLFDDDSRDFQTYSFAALERENSNPQRDLKNMMSILGR